MTKAIYAPVGSKVTLKNGSVWNVVEKKDYLGAKDRGDGGIYGRTDRDGIQSWFSDGSVSKDDEYLHISDDYRIVSVELPGLDFSKPLQSGGGTEVTLLSTEAKGDFPIVVQMPSGDIRLFDRQGKSKVSYFTNIRNVPPAPKEITKYINVYESGSVGTYSSRENADEASRIHSACGGGKRIACQKVVLIEGTFDS